MKKLTIERMIKMPRVDIYLEELIENIDYAKRIILLKKIIDEETEKKL